MSVDAELTTTAEPFDNETPTERVTRRFKTTDENKTEKITISVNNDVNEFIRDVSLRSAHWRSYGQFVNDALVYYLDAEGDTMPVTEILGSVVMDERNTLNVAVTETLFDEIEMMVKHRHTPWDTKQEFYTCALFAYIGADTPVIERR